ncbi:MAG: hypothetical protein ABW092_12105 [Candidatus Thiodiazotropha sp.]
MDEEHEVKVKTRADEDSDNSLTFVMFLILMGLAYGIGYKLSGKTDMGGYIGLGLGFAASMFIRRFREMIIILSVFFGAIALLALLVDWIMS